jgi:hypothetical protein
VPEADHLDAEPLEAAPKGVVEPGRVGAVARRRREGMHEEDPAAAEVEDALVGETAPPGGRVDVAADGVDRGDPGEVLEDPPAADVARVEDARDVGQRGRDARVEDAVGVGDDAEPHGLAPGRASAYWRSIGR